MLTDLIITTKDRPDLLKQTLVSLSKTTKRDQYRLTIVRDGSYDDIQDVLKQHSSIIDYNLCSYKSQGLGPSLNMALAHVDALKSWEETYNPWTCYVQDDVIFANGWLERLQREFVRFEGPMNLAFATGHDRIECRQDRPNKAALPNGMFCNDYIRATCMFAHQNTWMSMWPIPRIDPETGRERGRPNDGLGSGVDWHFVRVHQKSVVRTGRTCLVIPGLVMHNGFDRSTWLNRELPESDEDKKVIDHDRGVQLRSNGLNNEPYPGDKR